MLHRSMLASDRVPAALSICYLWFYLGNNHYPRPHLNELCMHCNLLDSRRACSARCSCLHDHVAGIAFAASWCKRGPDCNSSFAVCSRQLFTDCLPDHMRIVQSVLVCVCVLQLCLTAFRRSCV